MPDQPEATTPLEIRDLRIKDKFIIDDRFLNGYAKEVGIFGAGVYMSLCRHADKDQTCWPSINTIADELNISRFSVMRGLKSLKKCGIIGTIRLGRTCTNRYILYDRKHWRHRRQPSTEVANSNIEKEVDEVAISNISGAPQQHHRSVSATSKEGNTRKETQERIYAPVETGATSPSPLPSSPESLKKTKKPNTPAKRIQIWP